MLACFLIVCLRHNVQARMFVTWSALLTPFHALHSRHGCFGHLCCVTFAYYILSHGRHHESMPINIGFEQFTDGTTLQTSNFIDGTTWSYFDDESCVGGGSPRKCILGWRSTISPTTSTSRIEVAYASTYGYTNSTRVVAEVNSTRRHLHACITTSA